MNESKKFRRAVMWILTNGLLLWFTYLSIFYGTIWTGRIVSFWITVSVVMYWMVFFNETLLVKTRAEGRPVIPKTIDMLVDIVLLCAFVGVGWWFTAIMQLLQMIAYAGIFYAKPEADLVDKYRTIYHGDAEGNITPTQNP